MNKIYEEYKKEHPEELRQIEALKRNSLIIEEIRRKRREKKLARIEECRRALANGEHSI